MQKAKTLPSPKCTNDIMLRLTKFLLHIKTKIQKSLVYLTSKKK